MFTGIVKKLGPVTKVARTATGARITVDLGELAEDVGRGDSVSIGGVCLTVASKSGTACEFDAVSETLSRTTLGDLRPGHRVNVEPSLRVGDRLGGHFVLGHVDGVGAVGSVTASGDGAAMKVSAEPALTAQMVSKGSVAVDGVSLTLVDVGRDSFTCALIPTTLADTTLGSRKPGDRVNIETDVLGKLVAKYLGGSKAPAGLTLDKLREAGFA